MSHFEPGACLSLWPTEECEWSTWDIWRSTDVIEHAIYLILALMLGYTFYILIRFLLRYQSAHHQLRDFSQGVGNYDLRNRRTLIAELSRRLGTVKAIASLAPFLGLAGTAYGIQHRLFFGNVAMEHSRFVAWISLQIAFSLTTSAAGIIVAVPAVLIHNALRKRVELIQFDVSRVAKVRDGRERSFHYAVRLPLVKRFVALPPFAVIAALALAAIVCIFLTFENYPTPKGLSVLLPSVTCRTEPRNQTLLLRVAKTGELSINTEPVSRSELPVRLSQIYRTRAKRELYLSGEEEGFFQLVADAIDIARNPQAPGQNPLDIKVLLVTPASANCFSIPVRRVPVRRCVR